MEKFDLKNTIILNGKSVKRDLEKFTNFNKNEKLNICISNENDLSDSMLENLLTVFKTLCKNNWEFSVTIISNTEKRNTQTNTPYIYSSDEINKLISFNSSIKKLGIKDINFSENSQETWNINTVIEANNKLNTIVENLKSAKLSPYETMLAIHRIATNITYQDSKDGSKESPRCLPGLFSNGDIVCVGYSHFVKAIIDKLNMKGLKAEINVFSLYGRSTSLFAGGHANNRIIIDDQKYNIKGSYIEDSCWDAKYEKINKPRGFAHCMYVEKDLKCLKNYFFTMDTGLSMRELDIGCTLSAFRYGEEYDDVETLPELRIEANEGTQISLETFKKAYKTILLKKLDNKLIADIDKAVDKVVEMSAKHALDTFSEKSLNQFLKEGLNKNYTPLKQEINNSEKECDIHL